MCFHESDGPPLKAYLFDLPAQPPLAAADGRGAEGRYEVYAAHVLRAITHVVDTFPELSLHDRVALIVPDSEFREALLAPLARGLAAALPDRAFAIVDATSASAACELPGAASSSPAAARRRPPPPTATLVDGASREHTAPVEWLTLDTVDRFDGLERLIALAIGLDVVCNGATADAMLTTRSALYRALTRAHMMACVVNERTRGGWLEFLGLLTLDEGLTLDAGAPVGDARAALTAATSVQRGFYPLAGVLELGAALSRHVNVSKADVATVEATTAADDVHMHTAKPRRVAPTGKQLLLRRSSAMVDSLSSGELAAMEARLGGQPTFLDVNRELQLHAETRATRQAIWDPEMESHSRVLDPSGLAFNPFDRTNAATAESGAVLDLRGEPRVADQAFATVVDERAAELKRLLIANCRGLSLAGLTVISQLTHLIELDVSGTAISDGTIEAVAMRCLQLRRLAVARCALDAPAYAAIARHLRGLRYLDLTGCHHLDGTALHAMCTACAFVELNVAECSRLCDGGIGWASKLAHAEALTLAGTAADDAVLLAIAANCRRLTYLNACRCRAVGDLGVAAVARSCGYLVALHLAGCFGVSDAALEVPWAAVSVELLNLAGCVGVSDAGITHVARYLGRLQNVILGGTCTTDAGLAELARTCPALTSLDAKGCSGVGDAAVQALARGCPGLVQLDLRGARIISEASVTALEERLPRCRLLVNQQLKNPY